MSGKEYSRYSLNSRSALRCAIFSRSCFTYDTIGHSERVLRFLIDTVGCERIMLGSDFCYKIGYERPVDVVEQLRELSDLQRGLILRGNATRMLRLPSAQPSEAARQRSQRW